MAYLQGLCQQPVLNIPYTQFNIERTTLGVIVVCFDVAIVVSFVLSFYFLAYFEHQDQRAIDHGNLATESFAVVVKRLPPKQALLFPSPAALKAALWNHLERVVKAEPTQNPQMAADRDHSQIVSINFGMQKFTRIKMYQSIYDDVLEKRRAQERLHILEAAPKPTKEDKKAIAKNKKEVEKFEAKIAKQIEKCQKISRESTDDNEAIVAYVQFRSMEGKERALAAYRDGACRRCCLTYFCCSGSRYKNKK